MELELFHPTLARMSCADCQRYVMDYDWSTQRGTGKPKGPAGGDPWKRPPQSQPPCNKCPKRSPEEEHEHLLSDKNWQTYQLGRQVRATNGQCLSDAAAADPLLAANLAIVHQLIEARDRHDLAEQTAVKLALLMHR